MIVSNFSFCHSPSFAVSAASNSSSNDSSAIVGQVGGEMRAVAFYNQFAFVGVGYRVVAIKFSNPFSLNEVGSSKSLGSNVEDIAVTNNIAAVAAGDAGVFFLNVSNPRNLTMISSFNTAGYAKGIMIDGIYAYIADGPDGIYVLNISDLSQPFKVTSAFNLSYTFKILVNNGYAYIAAADEGLLLLDVSDPNHPVERSKCKLPGYAYSVAAYGSAICVADGWGGMQIVDISNKSCPIILSSFSTVGWALDISISGTKAYLVDGTRLLIIDISKSTAPIALGDLETKLGVNYKLLVNGQFAYMVNKANGLHIIDISIAGNLHEVSTYSSSLFATAVAITEKFAYVGSDSNGFHIINITNPTLPNEVAWVNITGYISGIVVKNNLAYVITLNDGFSIIDVSNNLQPIILSLIYVPNTMRDIDVKDSIAFIADEWGVVSVNVSNPVEPNILLALGFPGGVGGQNATSGVAVDGNIAYVDQAQKGVRVVNVTEPRNASIINTYYSRELVMAQCVAIGKGCLFVGTGWTITALNVSTNDLSQSELGVTYIPDPAERIAYSNDHLYVAEKGMGFLVIDVSNPSKASIVYSLQLPGSALGLALNEKNICIADGSGGLFIIDRNTTATTPISLQPNSPAIYNNFFSEVFPQLQSQLNDLFSTQECVQNKIYTPLIQQNPTNYIVNSSVDDGIGTLRWALNNAQTGSKITFSPDMFPPANPTTIRVRTQLPHLNAGNVSIDASNAGVILDGSSKTTEDAVGLYIESNYNSVKGLQVINFIAGIALVNEAKYNIIGGNKLVGKGPLGEGNLFSNNSVGLYFANQGTSFNKVQGNYIGTDISGSKAMSNMGTGVGLFDGPSSNIIGGELPSEGNLISGNFGYEVGLASGACNNTIEGNFIGTDARGQSVIGDAMFTVVIQQGGFGNCIKNNVIVSRSGIDVCISDDGSNYNRIEGNYIGLNANGTIRLGSINGQAIAVGFGGPSYNKIGGNLPNEKNVIALTTGDCVQLMGPGTNNVVIGNLIGIDSTGKKVLAGAAAGITFSVGATENFVGGSTTAEANTIGGCWSAIYFRGVGNDHNLVKGNRIGTDINGTINLGNIQNGIVLQGAQNNFVQLNVVSMNGQSGIRLLNNSNCNTVRANFIGDNGNYGVYVSNSEENLFSFNTITTNPTANAIDTGGNFWTCNFWGDYLGSDQNADGIGDTPYNFVFNNQDIQPIMHPYINHDGTIATIDGSSPTPTPSPTLSPTPTATPTPPPTVTTQPTSAPTQAITINPTNDPTQSPDSTTNIQSPSPPTQNSPNPSPSPTVPEYTALIMLLLITAITMSALAMKLRLNRKL